MLRWIKTLLGLRPRFDVRELGRGWRESLYSGDPHVRPFRFAFREITWGDRKMLIEIEDMRITGGRDVAEELARRHELTILARRVMLPGPDGALAPTTPEAIDDLGGQSSEVYAHLHVLVFAPKWREVREGDAKKKCSRRWRYARRVLISWRDLAATA